MKKKLGFLLSFLFFGITIISNAQVNKEDSDTKVLDLEKQTPFVMPVPTFDSLLIGSKKKPTTISFQLEEAIERDDRPVRAWLQEENLTGVEFAIPKSENDLNTMPVEIPSTYKEYRLTKGMAYKNCNIFFYGKDFSESRFLLITNTERTKILSFLDFENYTKSPKFIKADKDFVYEQLLWAMMDDKNVLYITNAHPTYAKSSFRQNAYVPAIDLKTNKVIWRSQPLVSNTNFAIIGDYVVTGYGFTDEKDYLYYLNRYTGRVQGRIPLQSAPNYIVFNFNRLYVDTYDLYYYFIIK